jgi:hypothetical protein
MLSLESRIFSTRQSKGRAGFSHISKGYFPDLHSEHGIVLIVLLYWQSPKNLMQREVGVMLLPQELQQVGSLLLRQEWIFAKTMPEDPRWYTLREGWACDADFVHVVTRMREAGEEEVYKGRRRRVLHVNGMKYWTMGAPLPQTILINRKPLGPIPSAYDPIAPVYDQVFSDPASQAENRALMAHIGDVRQSHVLDIGCGTGLFLDYLRPAAYTGIDPSFPMLTCLKAKHPGYADHVLACPLEAFVGGGYDLAVCLFGTANYIHPAYVEAIPALVRPGGRYLVMFFREGYQPVTYQRTGHVVPHWPGVHATLPGTVSCLGNFVLVDGTPPRP